MFNFQKMMDIFWRSNQIRSETGLDFKKIPKEKIYTFSISHSLMENFDFDLSQTPQTYTMHYTHNQTDRGWRSLML